MRPRLLDLYCGGGGAAKGYQMAGFYVVGVDIARQPHYCGDEFIRADAMTFPLAGFDAIHASPPCKLHTSLRATDQVNLRLFEPHTDCLAPTLERLAEWDCSIETPWVVENVPGAPMPDPVVYCGSSFGLRVRRHRLFSVSFPICDPPPCDHETQGRPVGVYGTGGAWDRAANPGGGGIKVSGAAAAAALGVDWTTHQPSLSQMIPPAYTEHIGRQMFAWLRGN